MGGWRLLTFPLDEAMRTAALAVTN